MKKFISIFLLLYITLPINAQDKTNELSGFIIHKQENGSNGSLDGANIFLIYAKDTLKTTSINGVFRFKPSGGKIDVDSQIITHLVSF